MENPKAIKARLAVLRKAQSQHALLFAHIADCHIKLKQVGQAAKILNKGLKQHPDYATGWVVKGNLHLMQNQSIESRKAFKRALEIDSEIPYAHERCSELAYDDGDNDDFIQHIQELVRLDPLDTNVQTMYQTAILRHIAVEKGLYTETEVNRLMPGVLRQTMLMHNLIPPDLERTTKRWSVKPPRKEKPADEKVLSEETEDYESVDAETTDRIVTQVVREPVEPVKDEYFDKEPTEQLIEEPQETEKTEDDSWMGEVPTIRDAKPYKEEISDDTDDDKEELHQKVSWADAAAGDTKSSLVEIEPDSEAEIAEEETGIIDDLAPPQDFPAEEYSPTAGRAEDRSVIYPPDEEPVGDLEEEVPEEELSDVESEISRPPLDVLLTDQDRVEEEEKEQTVAPDEEPPPSEQLEDSDRRRASLDSLFGRAEDDVVVEPSSQIRAILEPPAPDKTVAETELITPEEEVSIAPVEDETPPTEEPEEELPLSVKTIIEPEPTYGDIDTSITETSDEQTETEELPTETTPPLHRDKTQVSSIIDEISSMDTPREQSMEPDQLPSDVSAPLFEERESISSILDRISGKEPSTSEQQVEGEKPAESGSMDEPKIERGAPPGFDDLSTNGDRPLEEPFVSREEIDSQPPRTLDQEKSPLIESLQSHIMSSSDEETVEPKPDVSGEDEKETSTEPPEMKTQHRLMDIARQVTEDVPKEEDDRPPVEKAPKRIATKTLAELYASQGDWQRAVDVYEELLKRHPNNTVYKQRFQDLKDKLQANEGN